MHLDASWCIKMHLDASWCAHVMWCHVMSWCSCLFIFCVHPVWHVVLLSTLGPLYARWFFSVAAGGRCGFCHHAAEQPAGLQSRPRKLRRERCKRRLQSPGEHLWWRRFWLGSPLWSVMFTVGNRRWGKTAKNLGLARLVLAHRWLWPVLQKRYARVFRTCWKNLKRRYSSNKSCFLFLKSFAKRKAKGFQPKLDFQHES